MSNLMVVAVDTGNKKYQDSSYGAFQLRSRLPWSIPSGSQG